MSSLDVAHRQTGPFSGCQRLRACRKWPVSVKSAQTPPQSLGDTSEQSLGNTSGCVLPAGSGLSVLTSSLPPRSTSATATLIPSATPVSGYSPPVKTGQCSATLVSRTSRCNQRRVRLMTSAEWHLEYLAAVELQSMICCLWARRATWRGEDDESVTCLYRPHADWPNPALSAEILPVCERPWESIPPTRLPPANTSLECCMFMFCPPPSLLTHRLTRPSPCPLIFGY
ncbi:uncharacterized protein F5891DRAFT_253659 [Suillus fuscotomentosus]|uniref:Uncharacterized protein n=1 Tax=Suillus fuscotomentosus TaxID=1912939 RepID=A0AAD4E843_9AGAM|nr:uncharacterized protein F5891DRAFT_253659 [Suillus fuscotomentosus]KAG1901386.1 hypothetical protein F5891DRAFT_253659 [Suillus fuscotomentosus]